ncbi:MAG: anion permease, partial [Verrucomicrobiae bacterium]|nr:anion permease [Verrucomicrobiae bacterium]
MPIPKRQGGRLGFWMGLVLFVGVLGSLRLSGVEPPICRMAAVAALMAVWWITESVPLAATSLLPFVLFPVLGLMTSREIAPKYINSTIFLFLGGFLIALAMERWNLHRRVAL